MGLQSVHHILSLQLLPPHTLSLLQRGSLPRGAVLQAQAAPEWAPTGSQALPANLLWHGLLSPQGHRSWQEPAPAQGSPRGHSFLRASPCSGVGSSMGCKWGSAPHGLLRGCRDSLPHSCSGTSTPAPGSPPALLLR